MPYHSPAQQRYAHAAKERGEPWAQSYVAHGDAYMREAKKKGVKHGQFAKAAQPRYGDGGGRGRRIVGEENIFDEEISKGWRGETEQSRANRRAGGTALTIGGLLPLGTHWRKNHPEAKVPGKTKALVIGANAAGLAAVGSGIKLHSANRPRPKPVRSGSSEVDEALNKRDFNPEDARQRRLGAYTAGLAGAGGVLGYKGVRGAVKSTKALRGVQGLVGTDKEAVRAADEARRKGVLVTRRQGAYLGGSAASLAAAGGIHQHAKKARGRPWD